MSLHLNFEPHSWYMGFAIQKTGVAHNDVTDWPWNAYIDNGNTYQVDELHALTLSMLKDKIKDYHTRQAQRTAEIYARLEAKP